jgi:hypothetical protein
MVETDVLQKLFRAFPNSVINHSLEFVADVNPRVNSYFCLLNCNSEGNVPYCLCSRCNKPIKNILYVVQSDSTDIEMLYLGADCVKHLD